MSGVHNSEGELVCGECGCTVPTETLRERRDCFAAAALTGLLTYYGLATEDVDYDDLARWSVLQAEALLAALDKPKEA